MRRSIWLLVVLVLVFTGYTKQAPATEHKPGERLVKMVDGVEYAFRWCPAGKFTMGYEERNPHEVTLTQGFWMLETEVTQAMWQNVMGESVSQKAKQGTYGHDLNGEGATCPMYYVGWDDCQEFCRRLSSKIGMKITLPAEAQWEYACRAGTTGVFAGDLDEMGWYYDNSGRKVHPVGQKKPNAWGLYDMHGNVFEWCQDWYGEYPNGAVTDPTGPDSGTEHICRGGGWFDDARRCCSPIRRRDPADFRDGDLGFRVVGFSSPSADENASDSNKQMEQPQPEPQPQVSSNAEKPKAGERMVKAVDGVEYAFRWCPPGKFMMGSPESEEGRYDNETQHEVTLTQGFWMLETEVTQAMWQSVMGSNPSSFKGDNLPVEHVSWDDCQEFCRKLSSKIGLKITLPTEAQWEYACRAGSTGPYAGDLDAMGWYGRNSDGNAYPAGQKKPNAWGLYDMHGNVWEWCQDWYGEYPSGAVTDPAGPDSGSEHICRGGSWLDLNSARNCRSANRDSSMSDLQGANLGFRVVGSSSPSAGENASDSNKQMKQPQPEPQLQAPSNEKKHEAGERMVKTVDGVEYAFRWCPPGKFTMGSPCDEKDRDSDEGPQHEVTLTQGFWMLETEVTQAMWKSVMVSSPSWFKRDNRPVESVSWNDCQEFCRKLSSKIGLQISLPTEAQWEYACRAGTTGPYAGDSLDEMGWHVGNSGDKTHPVGQKKPNAWGLYDMHGNVEEWCSDWYGEKYYTESPSTDPTGPNSGSKRVIRGGDWDCPARRCRSANRNWVSPGGGGVNGGFRVVGFSNPSAGENAPDSNKQMKQPQPEPQPQMPSNAEKPKAGDRLVKTVDGVEYAFRWCPAGKFTMGSPKSEWDAARIPWRDYDEIQHEVTLTKGFWMLESQVTQAMWRSVMGSNPSKFKEDDDDLPVEQVSWDDCQEFCRKLSEKIGMEISLPTEAQWEYACRAGTTTPFSFGSTLNGDKANCDGTEPYGTSTRGRYLGKTTPVRSYIPNAWGLYDMHGNVWEWCQDWYGDYPSSAVTDPTGPEDGSYRIIRGGSWDCLARLCRSAYRARIGADRRNDHLGFRVVGSSE